MTRWLSALTVMVLLIPTTARANEDTLLKEAQQRIETHRQGDAVVVIVDENDKPIADAEVTIEQTRQAFLFGCNIFMFDGGDQQQQQAYRTRFAELFNFATLPFYWPSYEPRRGEPNHERTRRIAAWCQEQRIITKGHPLAWNYSDPRWLPEDPDEARALQMARIDDCVGLFPGIIDRWDVVNEATHFERDSFRQQAPKMTAMWQKAGRLEFTKECFAHARAANPAATLLINDYRTDEPYARLIEQLKDAEGKPLYDVIGIQSHMHGGVWTSKTVWEVCERFARFRVPLHFTELTILSGQNGWERASGGQEWPSTTEGEERQAEEVVRIYTLLFSHPAVEAITWWDLSDRGAWQRAPAGLLRRDLSPKPAYERLQKLVRQTWWTPPVAGKTDAAGTLSFRGFYGDYKASVRLPSGKEGVRTFTLAKDSKECRLSLGADAE